MRLLPACLALVCGCSENGGDETDALIRQPCPIGDVSKPAEMEIIFRAADRSLATASDGSLVPLFIPPQGGHVMFVGARARNLDCRVEVTSSLTDPCDGAVVTLEARPATLAVAGEWGEPDLPEEDYNIGNLPGCPLAGLNRDMRDQPYTLTIKVKDHDERTVSATVTIVPTCLPGDDACLCSCLRERLSSSECEASAVPAGADAAVLVCEDAGRPDATAHDAGLIDAGLMDAGPVDASAADAR